MVGGPAPIPQCVQRCRSFRNPCILFTVSLAPWSKSSNAINQIGRLALHSTTSPILVLVQATVKGQETTATTVWIFTAHSRQTDRYIYIDQSALVAKLKGFEGDGHCQSIQTTS